MPDALATDALAIDVARLEHRYGEHRALAGITFTVRRGEIFTFLGPNGGGKTTLFRLLSTLIPLQTGVVQMLDHDLATGAGEIRRQLGVVFQAPSLDRKLSVWENLRHQGHLYGLSGRALAARITQMLGRLGIEDRASHRVETLSGGLRRRVELAKGMLHGPRLLLLDEPSTGLDPGARSDLWAYLHLVRREEGVTIVMTTHLLEEADSADRIAILHRGELVALDTPDALRREVGGDSITITTARPQELAAEVGSRLSCTASVVGGAVRLQQQQGHQWIPRLVEEFGDRIESITLGKPTLEDVFIARTGHRFWLANEEMSGETAREDRSRREASHG